MKRILRLESVSSTNEWAWVEADRDAPSGTVLVAKAQTSGRGRFGRVWHSPPGTGLYLSMIYRDPVPLERVTLVTAVGAIAVTEAIRQTQGLTPVVRYPNDVLIGDRKVAGILVESRIPARRPPTFVIGIGINVNQKLFPEELAPIATSLREEVGARVAMGRVEREVIRQLDEWLPRIPENPAPISKWWKKHSSILKRRVRIRSKGRTVTGVVEDVDPLEGVIIRLQSGHPRGFSPERVEHLEVLE